MQRLLAATAAAAVRRQPPRLQQRLAHKLVAAPARTSWTLPRQECRLVPRARHFASMASDERIARIEHSLADFTSLKSENKLEEAASCLEECIKKESQGEKNACTELAAVHAHLGRLYLERGKTTEAMGAFTAASEICASNDAMQVDNPVWAFTLESVALGFHGIQDYNRADAFFREATRAFVTCYGEKSMPVVNVKKLLSDTLEAKQDLEGVIDIQQEIINLLEQDDFVDFKFELVMAQYASGRAHFQKERFDAATLMAERARSQLSKLDQSLSNVQFYIARCEELLGHVQTATGDKEAATDSYKAALQSFHRALGDKEFQKYPSVAYMLTSLGTLELGRGNVDKSLTLLTQAHQMMIKYPHPAQGSLEMLLHALGSALMHDKQFEAAIEVFLGIVAKSEDSVLQATSLLYITQANMLQSKCHETLESLEVTVDYFLEQKDKGQLASMFEDKLTECLAAVHGKFSSNFTDADKSIFKRIVDKVAKLKN